jgi:hypothetical protein
MAKFSRFDPNNKKRNKDKFQSRDRDIRFKDESRETKTKYNKQHLTQAAQNYKTLVDL